MATTLVEHPTTLPAAFSNPLHSRKRSALDTYDPTLPPIHSARWSDHDELSPRAQPQNYSSSDALAGNSVRPALSKSSSHQAKLKKKQSPTHRGGSSDDNPILTSTPHESTTQMGSADSEAQPSKSKHRRSLSKENYLKTLHKRLREKDGDNSTIDLSLTMEENEKRSGLAISSQTQSPDIARDADNHFHNRAHRHNRSWSANSISASDVNLVGPTMGFMEPVKRESRPHTPITNRHSFTELEWKLCPDAIDTKSVGLGIDPAMEPRQRAATFDAAGLPNTSNSQMATPSTGSNTWDAATSAPVNKTSRPRMKVRLSNGSSTKLTGNASQSTISSTKQGRPRRSTAQSRDSTAVISPLTRTSTDRTFSFKRGFSSGSKETSVLSEEDRAVAVDAAREQYRQKQAAKARKYDERDRKAKEKLERKISEQHERKIRRSSSSSNPQAKSRSRTKEQVVSKAPKGKDAEQRTTPRRREGLTDGVGFEHTPRQANRKQSSSGFLSWCKTHILHVR